MAAATPQDAADRRHLAVLLLALLGPLALARPIAEGGVIDEFAYVHMAKTLADTGRFAYNGWPTAMLGLQVWWAAAWVRLFGFSFAVVRLSVLPLAWGAAACAYLLARRASLAPRDALFVALSLVAMPLFFRLAPTFMTDLPALCFLLASLYAFVRAAETPDRSQQRPWHTVAWLVAATAVGMAGGTIRQNVWLAGPVGAACILGLRDTSRPARLAAAACFVLGTACLVAGVRWFNHQPYAIHSRLAIAMPPVHVVAGVAATLQKAAVQLLPVLALCLPPLLAARVRPRTMVLVLIGSVAAACGLLWAQQRLAGSTADPALTFGFWGGLGETRSFARSLLAAGWLSLRLAPVVAAIALAGIEVRRRGMAALADAARLPPALLIPFAYLGVYTGIIALAAATTGGIFDRYVLPHIPILATWVILYTRRSLAASAADAISAGPGSRWGWSAVAIAAAIATADTHDSFALTRARLQSVRLLQAGGTPRERIMAGIALDGWEQIERAGHVNDPRLRLPPGAYRALPPDGYPTFRGRVLLSALVPEYIVTADPTFLPGAEAPAPTVPLTTWLPPYDQAVRVHRQPHPVRPSAAGRQPGAPQPLPPEPIAFSTPPIH